MGAGVSLELLARDAAVVEYERPVLEARARRAPAGEIEELERAKLHPLQVRMTLERRRRREAELMALFDTVGEIAAEQYFAHGGSLARTREVLHVHVNTVTQRLERIGRLLGEDWNSPERALEVQLALKLHRAGTGARRAGEATTPSAAHPGPVECADELGELLRCPSQRAIAMTSGASSSVPVPPQHTTSSLSPGDLSVAAATVTPWISDWSW